MGIGPIMAAEIDAGAMIERLLNELGRAADALLADLADSPLDPGQVTPLAIAHALLAMYWEVRHQHAASVGEAGDAVTRRDAQS